MKQFIFLLKRGLFMEGCSSLKNYPIKNAKIKRTKKADSDV